MRSVRTLVVLSLLFAGRAAALGKPIKISERNRGSFTDITQICSVQMNTACKQKGKRRVVVGVVLSDFFVPVWRAPRKVSQCWDIPVVEKQVRRKVRRVLRYGVQPVDPISDRPGDLEITPFPRPTIDHEPTPRSITTPHPTRTRRPRATPTEEADPPLVAPIDTVPYPVVTATPIRTSTPITLTPTASATPRNTNTPVPTRTATPAPTRTRTPTPQPTFRSPPSASIPELSRWETNMKYYGGIHCLNLGNPGMDKEYKLASTYYDSSLVFFKIADYTNDPAWLSCAEAAEKVYRDAYVMPSVGAVPGYWNFSHGLVQDYLRTGDDRSRRAAVMLSQNAAYAGDQTPLEWTRSADYSREVAYAIMSYLNAEDCGEGRRSRLDALVGQAFDHLDQWFVRQNAPYVRPFMVALTSQALITYHERTGDSRVLPALTRAADWLWDRTWLPREEAFMYTDREHSSGGREPAPDLNLLIAPLYGWLYHQTGEPRFAERGDQIFAGGVRQAFLDHGKQFNQSYRWSFEYVQWRSGR